MATIDLITYDQKMVTPKDDALIHQFGISNGVLYGCDVTLADSNTLHITGGQGVIYGRQWEITEGDITVTLPASGSLKGRLYVKIDLSNTTNPIELLVQTDVTLPDLTDDDQINVNNSVSELELYTFDVSSLTISNLVKTVETVADGDHADVVQMQNDISQLNSSLSNKQDKLDNGIDILLGGAISTNISTSGYTNITIDSIAPYTLIHFNTSYYVAGRPNYGGITLSVAQIRNYRSEAFTVARVDNSYRFNIKYVNDTTLAVMVAGTQGANNCLSIHAIL